MIDFEKILAATPLLHSIYKHANVHSILVSDKDGYILHCNKSFEHTYGYTLSDLKGRHGRILFTEEDQKKLLPEREVETTISQGFFRDRNYIVHKNGNCIFTDGESLRTNDGEGNLFIFKIVQNIHIEKVMEHQLQTVERKAADILQQSERRFRNLIEEAIVATAVYIGADMRIEYANDAMLKIMGKGKSVLGKPFLEALPELKNQPFYDLLNRVFTTGETYWGKEDKADVIVEGKLYSSYYNFSYKPLRNEKGEIYGILNMTIDVGEQVRAKKRIQESERLLRTLVMQAPVGICIVQKDTLLTELVNDTFLELIGKSRETLQNRSFWESIPEAKEHYAPILQQVFDTGETYQGIEHEVMLVRNDKEEIVYVNFVYEPLISEEAQVNRVLMLAIDVTLQVLARKKIEEVVNERTKELAEANKNLQKSNAELAQFAYIASHDLQEPLRKIRIFCGYLQTHSSKILGKKEHDVLMKITAASKRMTDLINDILDYSRVDAASKQNKPTMVDLNKVLRKVEKDLEIEIQEKQAIIEADELPAIPAIEVQMNQLFYNLLSNSLKFTYKDNPPVIQIKAGTLSESEAKEYRLPKETQYRKITFQDNGIGFGPHYKEKIFTMFQRLHGRHDYEGTGIGLAICKKVLDNHNGMILAESKEGEGACFTVILPTTRH